MAQLLVRNLDDKLVRTIKKIARSNKRSVEGEVRLAIERSFPIPSNRKAVLSRIRRLAAHTRPDPQGWTAADIVRHSRKGG